MYSEQLYDFLLSIRYDSLSEHVANLAKMCIQDLLGVAIAGETHKDAAIWTKYFVRPPQPEESTVWRKGFPKMGYRDAAALNAAYGHLLDFDDVHNSSITHLGVITIPTGLALAERDGLSGRDLIAAVVAGYEAGARIGEAINPSSYWYWHTTAVVGSFASACVAAKLLGLDKEQFINCMGSAGTQGAGLWQFLKDGAMSKPLHTANANLCGIRSAELAQLGLTGAREILEGERGFIRAVAPEYNFSALNRSLGEVYRIETNSFKSYACCGHTHSAIGCAESVLKKHKINPEKITEIVDHTYQTAVQLTDQPSPSSIYGYKFSLQYCIAAALIYHDLSDGVFTQEKTSDPAIQTLMNKIRVVVDEEIEKAYKSDSGRWPHRLEIRTTDGNVIYETVEFPLGDYRNPFDWETADRKFNNLTEGILPDAQRERLLINIKNLEQFDSINKLFVF